MPQIFSSHLLLTTFAQTFIQIFCSQLWYKLVLRIMFFSFTPFFTILRTIFAAKFSFTTIVHIFSCQCQHHLYVNQYFVFNIRINNSISCLCQPEVYVNLYKMPIIRIRIYFYVNKKFILCSQYKNH